MSNFTFNCPHCGNPLEAQEEWRGQQTDCPYCSQTITIPTEITLKKPNIAKRAIPQAKKIIQNFIQKNKKQIVLPIPGILCGLAVVALIVHKMNKETDEAFRCKFNMKTIANSMDDETKNFLDFFNDYKKFRGSFSKCASGDQYIFHLDNNVSVYDISPGAVVLECPKHRNHVITKGIYGFYPIFREEEFDRSIPIRRN